MKNNCIDARLRRDEATAAGLLEDQASYAPLEEEMKPLREAYADNSANQDEELAGRGSRLR